MTVNTTLKNSVALDTLDDTAAKLQALLETVDVRVAVLPDLYSLLHNVSIHIAVLPDTVNSLLSDYLEKFKAVVADYCGGSQGGTVKPSADDPSVHFTLKRLEEVGGLCLHQGRQAGPPGLQASQAFHPHLRPRPWL